MHNPQSDFHTPGERLRWAIDRVPPDGQARGIRRFQREMAYRAKAKKAAGGRLPGVTLPSIAKYLNDEVEPPLSFLIEAASVLRVRPAWLAFNDGYPTEPEAPVYRGDPLELGGGANPWLLEEVVEIFQMVLHPTTEAHQAAIDAESHNEIFPSIQNILNAPFRLLGLQPEEHHPGYKHYMRAMLNALLLVPGAGTRI